MKAAELRGADSVAGLLRGGSWADLTEIWRLGFEMRLNEFGDLQRFLILDVGSSSGIDESPLLRIEMEDPGQCSIPDATQILGLAIDDISENGWDGIRYRLYDYESSDFDVLCRNVALKLQPKPEN